MSYTKRNDPQYQQDDYGVEWNDKSNNKEITALRQQVAELTKHRDELLKHIGERTLTPTGLEQLALRDLEIVKLREALNSFEISDDTGLQALWVTSKTAEQIDEALSTTYTTEHLDAWLKEKIGEPVAWKYNSLGTDYITEYEDNIIGISKGTKPTSLYAVKELK